MAKASLLRNTLGVSILHRSIQVIQAFIDYFGSL
ncbi:MAG: hypothetical protein K0S24_1541 [Sphingobacterium sp.]|jgi:hypothetical protein|nr:hypothetical protein [Sphingobacterium sp.]